MTPPTLEEVLDIARTAERVLSAEVGPMFRSFIEFGVGSLLRPGEMCVLQWTDIDFEHKRIYIRRNLRSTGTVALPKNQKARVVALTPLAEEAVHRLPRYVNAQTVFVNSRGEHLNKASYSRYWDLTRRAYAEKTGRPELTGLHFYFATKHAGAAWMLNVLGIGKDDLSIQLGHSSQALVDLYAHPSEDPAIRRILDIHGRHRVRPAEKPGDDADMGSPA